MEREIGIKFKYIDGITLKDLENTIKPKELESFYDYKEKILKGNRPFKDRLSFGYVARPFYISGRLVPENLADFIELLPEEKQETYTYNDLKKDGFDLIIPNKKDVIKSLSNKYLAIDNKLLEYFEKQKHVTPPLIKEECDMLDRMAVLYSLKGLECPELLSALKNIKLGKKPYFNSYEESHLLESFLQSLYPEEKMFIFPRTVDEIQNLESKLSVVNSFERFTILRNITGYMNLSLETIDSLIPYIEDKKCLEICSGTGLFSHLLQEKGIDVTATDIANEKDNVYTPLNCKRFTDIKQMDGLEAIKKYEADVLILAWPPYDEPIARDAAKAFFEKNPKGQILYVGESVGGCTASDDFFSFLNKEGADFRFLESVKYKSLYGIHDAFYLLSLN